MSNIRYRADIDGLRAVAVLPVILFHAGLSVFSGGFVGVDVFFVISGFLITSILYQDIQNNNFSLVTFWERRIRRIIPALFVVVISCLIAGWFLLLPKDYELLAQQAFAQTIFSSNILFFLQSGYFDTANETKPLLHTWSLAVEEQFYFFFPLTLFLIWKYARGFLERILIAGFLVSLVLSIYAVDNHPVAAFYLLPTRAWELLVGALIVFLPLHAKLRGKYLEILSVSGLLAILVAVFLYSKQTDFPGAAALLPCLGAGFLIWAGKDGDIPFANRILTSKPLVFIGKISYSWYLWHWPIIVFYKYYVSRELADMDILFVLTSSFVLSVLSWKFIEAPFRGQSISRRQIFSLAVVALCFVLGPALLTYQQKGYDSRFSSDVLVYASAEQDKNPFQSKCNRPGIEQIKSGQICMTNEASDISPSFILWGDSHADAIAPAFYTLSQANNLNGYIATYDGCPPISGIEQRGREASFYCTAFNEAVLSLVRTKHIKNVYMVSAWGNWLYNPKLYIPDNNIDASSFHNIPDNSNITALTALDQTISALSKTRINLTILHSIPTASFDPPRELALQAAFHEGNQEFISIPLSFYNQKREALEVLEEKYRGYKNIRFMDPKNFLCDSKRCKVSFEGRSLYYNGGHISVYGAHYLEDMIAPYLLTEGRHDKS